jgi:hypothetical protein
MMNYNSAEIKTGLHQLRHFNASAHAGTFFAVLLDCFIQTSFRLCLILLLWFVCYNGVLSCVQLQISWYK